LQFFWRRAFDCGDMEENIRAAAVRPNEDEPPAAIEPFDGCCVSLQTRELTPLLGQLGSQHPVPNAMGGGIGRFEIAASFHAGILSAAARSKVSCIRFGRLENVEVGKRGQFGSPRVALDNILFSAELRFHPRLPQCAQRAPWTVR
jgi:hypothetical protein